jgi:L-threonylcarbamoyladenylate synthase
MVHANEVVQAARILRSGGLVAFPTETVYGLGADARHTRALERLYQVKGRPVRHPVIVHLVDGSRLEEWAGEVPPSARRLIEVFWPGPLTVVLRRHPSVLDQVTGGQDTVAIRVPAHPLALELLREFRGGLAAPSANRFGRVSPTTAEHVRADLGSDVDLVLDGGACRVGVESTIVNLADGEAQILRPGGVTQEDIERILGRRVRVPPAAPIRAPGTLEAHYAPRARVEVLPEDEIGARAEALRSAGRRVVVLERGDVAADRLYASLRRADADGADVILAPAPREEGIGRAVADRLRKAAGGGSA